MTRARVMSGFVGGLVFLFVFAFGAASAFAVSPWWHLMASSRPTFVRTGVAELEVQRVTVKATGGGFVLAHMTKKEVEHGEFFTEEGEPKFAEFGFAASAAEVQAGLEGVAGIGAGNVEVTGGPGSASGSTPYVVRFKGALAFQGVGVLNTEIPAEAGVGGALQGEVVASELAAGRSDGEIVLTAENVGDAPLSGEKTSVRLTDVLPAGFKAVGIAGTIPAKEANFQERTPVPCSLATLRCTLTGVLQPYDQLEMRISVVLEGAASSGELNEASVAGGNAVGVSVSRPVTVSNAAIPFGVEEYAMLLEEEGGATVTQAGAHPFQLTTTIGLNEEADTNPLKAPRSNPEVTPAGIVKDLNFRLPPGLIGNATVFPQCTTAEFFQTTGGKENACPPQSAMGVAVATIHEPATIGTSTVTVPVFNLEPRVGEPARFGFFVVEGNAPVFIDTSLRTGGDYGVTASVQNVTQTAAFLSSSVTFWGVPGDPRHDGQRGWGCLFEARNVTPHPPCNPSEDKFPKPFLAMPTSCTGPLHTSVEVDSWQEPKPAGQGLSFEGEPMSALDGCNRLPFSASIRVGPDGQAASTPTGLTTDVHVPQEESLNAAGLAPSELKDISVTLPEGVKLNPAAADGLQACGETQIGYLPGESNPSSSEFHFTAGLPQPFCPSASKVATVKIKTPLLPNPLEGAVYLASQEANPFGSLIAMYLVAEDPVSGSLVKLPGVVSLDQATGRITGTFPNNPQLPFEDAELHFFGGDRAPLATPARCGSYTTTATFTPWSGASQIGSQSSFDINSGPNGTPCPATLPFTPSLAAGMTNIQAGAFSPLTTTITRQDGNQDIHSVQLQMAPGLEGTLASVKLCGEAEANAGTCGPESLIGETTVSVGLGGDPFTVTGGKAYISGPYHGAPFGLSIVNPAKAGPFDLEKNTLCDCVVVRAQIAINPLTEQLTVTTDSTGPYQIPSILDGIPLEIKHVNVTVNRPGFTLNPTSCSPFAINGTITSTENTSALVSTPFQVTNCATLKFAPTFKVSTSAHTSKENGAALNVKLSYPKAPIGTYANVAKVKVDLPKQLPSRLTTLQKACLAAVFEANPANCPPASIVGHAKAITPLLPVPVEGPAYFVSHGNEAFPSLTMLLKGYGVTAELIGSTLIKKGITSTTFKATPDVPFNTFELTLPQGKYSALGANGSLCTKKLVMPTAFVAQNGLEKHQNTPITVTGCHKTPTPAQKLANALKACHKHHNPTQRHTCEQQAHKHNRPNKK